VGKKKKYKSNTKIWTEEEYEKYLKGLYGLEYIAGYTEGGIPYGMPLENDDNEICIADKSNKFDDPFEK